MERTTESQNNSKEGKSWIELRDQSANIEFDMRDCLETSNGSNSGIGICLAEAHSAWDGQLNDVYGKLMSETKDGGVTSALKNSERKWVGFKENEEKVINQIGASDDPSNFDRRLAKLGLTKDRAIQLEISAPGTETGTLGEKADDCLSSARNAKELNACIIGAIKESDNVLNQAYKDLRENLSPAEKNLVKNSQLKWLEFRDAENIYADRLHPKKGTSINEDAAAHKIRVNQDRADELWALKRAHDGSK